MKDNFLFQKEGKKISKYFETIENFLKRQQRTKKFIIIKKDNLLFN